MTSLNKPFKLIKKSVTIFFEKKNFIFFLKIYAVLLPFVIFSIAQTYFLKSSDISKIPWLSIALSITGILYFLASLLVWAAGVEAIKRILSNEKLSFKAVFSSSLKKLLPLIALSIILFLIVGGGFVLLIIPGIVFLVWFFFSKFLLIDQGLKIGKALSKSKQIIKGKFWSVFWNLLVFGVFTIGVGLVLGFVPYGIGSVINELLGALFILPSFLLYRDLV